MAQPFAEPCEQKKVSTKKLQGSRCQIKKKWFVSCFFALLLCFVWAMTLFVNIPLNLSPKSYHNCESYGYCPASVKSGPFFDPGSRRGNTFPDPGEGIPFQITILRFVRQIGRFLARSSKLSYIWRTLWPKVRHLENQGFQHSPWFSPSFKFHQVFMIRHQPTEIP